MGWQDAPLAQPEGDAWANAPIVTAGPPRMPPINQSREGLAPERAMAGLKLGSEGVARYLESRYGSGNVATDRDGSFYVKDKGEWIPFDSPDVNMRDVFDLSGLAVAAAPAVGTEALLAKAATTIPRALMRGAASGALGSVTQQAVGAVTPGGDPMSAGGRVAQLLLDTATGGVGDAVATGVSRFPGAVRNTYLQQTGQADIPVAREGEQISQYLRSAYNPATDGPMDPSLTPGQRSQRKGLLTLEGALRRSPTGASPLFQAKDEIQLVAAKRKFDEMLGKISANPRNREMLGMQVIKAFDDTITSARNVRRTQARSDFAAVDSAAGGAPVFRLGNTVATLDELISRYNTPGGGDTTASLTRQLRGARDALADAKGNLSGRSAQELQRLMEVYGEAAAGTGKVFGDIDTAQQRNIARQIMQALERDLDAVANAGTAESALATALKTARDNYRQNSLAIDELRKSSVGRILGNKPIDELVPERVADQLMGMEGSQLRQTFTLLDRADPDLAGDAKRAMLERAMLEAQPPADKIAERLEAGSMGIARTGTIPETYSPARLLTNLSKSKAVEVMTRDERYSLARLSAALQRLANRAGTEGSPTAPVLWAMDVAKNFMAAGLTGDMVSATKLAASIFGPTQIAKAITSPDSLNALATLTQPKPTREAVMAAVATLGGLGLVRGIAGEDVRPFSSTPMPGAPATPQPPGP